MDNFDLLYAKELDAWILQTSDETDEDGNINGLVLYVGDNKDLTEQQDDLLDLILEKDENEEYYKSILTHISNL